MDRRADRFWLLPLLAALSYPFLLLLLTSTATALHVAKPSSTLAIIVSVAVALGAALAVTGLSFLSALRAGAHRARLAAHLAFAAPSLLVGFGNVAGILHQRPAMLYAWAVFWLLAAGILAWKPQPSSAPMSPLSRRRLGMAHGISALGIILLFVALHLGNHLTGIWNGASHIASMKLARLVYRRDIIEPVLLALIAFQIISGFVLLRSRLRQPADSFGTVQTLSGFYVGIYLLAHMTAAFSARYAGTDTNWNWLTDNDQGLLDSLASIRLVAHYWIGPIALLAHIGCGLRLVMLEHGVSTALSACAAIAMMLLGLITSSIILLGLLGVHIA